jgi:hypothetical protein
MHNLTCFTLLFLFVLAFFPFAAVHALCVFVCFCFFHSERSSRIIRERHFLLSFTTSNLLTVRTPSLRHGFIYLLDSSVPTHLRHPSRWLFVLQVQNKKCIFHTSTSAELNVRLLVENHIAFTLQKPHKTLCRNWWFLLSTTVQFYLNLTDSGGAIKPTLVGVSFASFAVNLEDINLAAGVA